MPFRRVFAFSMLSVAHPLVPLTCVPSRLPCHSCRRFSALQPTFFRVHLRVLMTISLPDILLRMKIALLALFYVLFTINLLKVFCRCGRSLFRVLLQLLQTSACGSPGCPHEFWSRSRCCRKRPRFLVETLRCHVTYISPQPDTV